MWIDCRRVDIPGAVSNIRKDHSKAVLVLRIRYTDGERTRDCVVWLTNLNKVVLPAGQNVYQHTKGQAMQARRWPTEFHYVDGGLKRADATDFMCVNRVIVEPWPQCFAVSRVDIGKLEDLLCDEQMDLAQGYMYRPVHDWVGQREQKGQEKAWSEVDTILSGSYDKNTFVRRVLDHMSS